MGLRFRKSITLCKGVRLNIGKTGVSISAGIPGFRKTFHSSGRVTTSVGIPGTGLYYVDTKNPTKKTRNTESKKTRHQTASCDRNPMPQTIASTDDSPAIFPTYTQPAVHQPQPVAPIKKTPVEESIVPIPDAELPSSLVTELFESCDYPVKWIDVLTNAQPLDENYNLDTWEYLRSKAISVFEGDVEAILEIIERINPYDDLLDYLTDFEIEADSAECIEVTCRIIQNSLGTEKDEATASLMIRLARDTFALLPIGAVRIHMNNASVPFNDAYFERNSFVDTLFEDLDVISTLNKLTERLK